MNGILENVMREVQDLETVGVAFGLVGAGLTIKENIWCWIVGILNVIIFGWIFFHSAIYGQVILQFIFLILILYGWYQWLYGGINYKSLRIRKISFQHSLYFLILTIVLMFLLENGIRFISASEKFTRLDAGITALSLVAQFLQGKKILESWIVWIIVDVLSIFLFFQTGLFKISFFYLIVIIFATAGYFIWKRKLEA